VKVVEHYGGQEGRLGGQAGMECRRVWLSGAVLPVSP